MRLTIIAQAVHNACWKIGQQWRDSQPKGKS